MKKPSDEKQKQYATMQLEGELLTANQEKNSKNDDSR